jgi:hypothetical protein
VFWDVRLLAGGDLAADLTEACPFRSLLPKHRALMYQDGNTKWDAIYWEMMAILFDRRRKPIIGSADKNRPMPHISNRDG